MMGHGSIAPTGLGICFCARSQDSILDALPLRGRQFYEPGVSSRADGAPLSWTNDSTRRGIAAGMPKVIVSFPWVDADGLSG